MRRLLVVLLALLLAVQVVRNSAVAALADRSPDTAARFWNDHPAAELSLGLTEIGRAARQGKPVGRSILEGIDKAAVKAPLASEPFLVRGVQAQLSGNPSLALDAFTAAERRDPRSLPAHYFLADLLFRLGDNRRGLQEVGVLARLAPNGLQSVAPYVAAYARDRTNWPRLRDLFRSNPELEEGALEALASDAANADTIMALADTAHRGPQAIWLPALLNSLVADGQAARARAVWAQVAGLHAPAAATIYDPRFADASSPPPFNWNLTSSAVGLAERQAGGRLHVIYYGHDDGVLARQLLVLAPGRYRMTLAAAGNAADARALTWSLRCDQSQTPLSAIPVDVAASRGWTFNVPSACPAQWLELSGVSTDAPHQAELWIGKVAMAAERPND